MKKSNTHRLALWLICSGITTALLYIFPSFRFGTPVWIQPTLQLLPHSLLVAAHLITGLILGVKLLLNRKVHYLEIVFVTAALFGFIFLWLFLIRSSFSRSIAPMTLILSIGSQCASLFIVNRESAKLRKAVMASMLATTVLVYALVLSNIGGILEKASGMARESVSQIRSNKGKGPRVKILDTAFYKLDALWFENYFEPPLIGGGGFVEFGEDLMLMTGDGKFYILDLNSKPNDMVVTPLDFKVPGNYYDFINEAPASAQKFHFWFRVAGVHLMEKGNEIQIFATYHYWKSDTSTFVVRLARLQGSREQILSSSPDLQWEVMFESTPDLQVKPNLKSDITFAGLQIGGRIQMLDDNTLLFSVGDHEHDGWNFAENYPQDPDASYGKMIKLDLTTGQSEIFSTGHRNPQGLYIDPAGTIWSTEHGPQGGGELNIIKENLNYGWPTVTFGTEYGMREWPNGKVQADHTGYEYPVYTWSQSEALSGLTGLEKNLFPTWKGDLIIPTLKARSLFRVKIHNNRAITHETIALGQRLRDVKEDQQGRIVVWCDRGQIVVIQPSATADIALPPEFVSCSACHPVNPGEAHRIGPNLTGIFGKNIASSEAFKYSPALLNVKGKWTEDSLDTYLQNPQAFAPGNIMVYPGNEDAEQRKKLIEFLKSL